MLSFTIRRLLLAIPTLLFISLVIFLLLEASPGDPLGDVPLTVPPEVRERMRSARTSATAPSASSASSRAAPSST